MRVLGVGLTAFDHIAEVERIPGPDEHEFMLGYTRQAGGIVGNALTAAARLGLDTAWVGKVGNNEHGRFILNAFRDDGIDTSRVIVESGADTPFCIVLVDRRTRGRTLVFNRGCSVAYGAELDDDFISGFDVIHLDGFFSDVAIEAARSAKRLGVKVSLDAGLTFPTLEELMRLSDIFVPTRAIATYLTGEKDMAAALRKLVEAGPEIVAVTMGAEGSIGLWNGELVHAPGFAVDAIDTTAAGDTYHGAFLYAWLKKKPLEHILTFANAMAALKCTRPGGRGGIPRLEEVREFLKKHGLFYKY